MMGMGSDKKVGSLLIALSGGMKAKEGPKDPYSDIVSICAERVIEAFKANDPEMLIKELPKLLAVLPSPEFESEDEGESEMED
jgi:hypothetical protein